MLRGVRGGGLLGGVLPENVPEHPATVNYKTASAASIATTPSATDTA